MTGLDVDRLDASVESELGRSVPVVLVTPEEAAQALRVSRSKVYALMRSGALHSVKIGGSRRIPVQALHLLVDSLVRAA